MVSLDPGLEFRTSRNVDDLKAPWKMSIKGASPLTQVLLGQSEIVGYDKGLEV